MTRTDSNDRARYVAGAVLVVLVLAALVAIYAIVHGYQPPARPIPVSVEQKAAAAGVIART